MMHYHIVNGGFARIPESGRAHANIDAAIEDFLAQINEVCSEVHVTPNCGPDITDLDVDNLCVYFGGHIGTESIEVVDCDGAGCLEGEL